MNAWSVHRLLHVPPVRSRKRKGAASLRMPLAPATGPKIKRKQTDSCAHACTVLALIDREREGELWPRSNGLACLRYVPCWSSDRAGRVRVRKWEACGAPRPRRALVEKNLEVSQEFCWYSLSPYTIETFIFLFAGRQIPVFIWKSLDLTFWRFPAGWCLVDRNFYVHHWRRSYPLTGWCNHFFWSHCAPVLIIGSGCTTQKLYVAGIEAFWDDCVARDTINNAPIACKHPQGTPPPPPFRRPLGIWPLHFTRWWGIWPSSRLRLLGTLISANLYCSLRVSSGPIRWTKSCKYIGRSLHGPVWGWLTIFSVPR